MELWDAILAVMMAIWLNDLANDVFSSKYLLSNVLSLSVESFKILFLVVSIIYVFMLVRASVKWDILIQKVSWDSPVRVFFSEFNFTLLVLIGLLGFLIFTSNVIPTTVSIYKIILFASMLPIWIISKFTNKLLYEPEIFGKSKHESKAFSKSKLADSDSPVLIESLPSKALQPKTKSGKERSGSYRRLFVACLALALIIIRVLVPSTHFDCISLVLFCIICLAILWTDLEKLFVRK